MPSSSNAAVQILTSERAEQRVEVAIEQCDGLSCLALRYQTWTDGLGWCNQKTIRLEGTQLDELHRALTVARHRINDKRAEAGQVRATSQVIQLPRLA